MFFGILLIALGMIVWKWDPIELFIPENRRDNSKVTKTTMFYGLILILWGVGIAIVSYLVSYRGADATLHNWHLGAAFIALVFLKLYILYHYPKHNY